MASVELLKTAAVVDFDVLETDVQPSADGEELLVRIELHLGEVEDDGERSDDVEWGAFGFMYALAVLSFHDARPRGYSETEYGTRTS